METMIKSKVTMAPDQYLGEGEIIDLHRQIYNHAERNLIQEHENKKKAKVRKCGDGRDNTLDGEAIFGADLGYEMITTAAMRHLLSDRLGAGAVNRREFTKDIAGFTLDILAADTGKNYAHSDSHVPDTEVSQFETPGCGHFKKGFLQPEDYNLTKQDFEVFDELTKERANLFEIKQYKGSHHEVAVILVEDPKIALRAHGEEVDVFVVNEGKIKIRLHQLAKEFAKKYKYLNEREIEAKLLEEWNIQQEATRSKLAAGKPVFKLKGLDKHGKPKLVLLNY